MARRRKRKKDDIIGPIIGLVIIFGFSQGFSGGSNVLDLAHNILWAVILWGGGCLVLVLAVKWLLSRRNGTGQAYVVSSDIWRRLSPSEIKPHRLISETAVVPNKPSVLPHRPAEWTVQLIKNLAWQRLEKLTAEVLGMKYRAELTDTGADGGIDLRLYLKDGSRAAPVGLVQVKSRSKQRVGVSVVRELRGVMAVEKVPNGVLVGTSGFTDQAKDFASNSQIQLIDGDRLFKMISALPKTRQETLLSDLTSGDFSRPDCPSCSVPLIKRKAAKGGNKGNEFWGCCNYPRCKTIINVAG